MHTRAMDQSMFFVPHSLIPDVLIHIYDALRFGFARTVVVPISNVTYVFQNDLHYIFKIHLRPNSELNVVVAHLCRLIVAIEFLTIVSSV